MCLLVHEGRVLVADGNTLRGKEGMREIVPGNFYRVLGGSMNFGERAEDAVRRELREELDCEIENLTLLKVVENHFEYAGEQGHEIVFLFSRSVSNAELTKVDTIHVDETDYEFDARWVKFEDILTGATPLKPGLDYASFLSLSV